MKAAPVIQRDVEYSSERSAARAKLFPSRLNDLDGSQWVRGTKSVMFQNGLGARGAHTEFERRHPAPFGYLDAEKLIRFFSREDEIVLDPFAGVASTLKASALSRRVGIGIELNPKFVELGRQRLIKEVPAPIRKSHPQKIRVGDSRQIINRLTDDSIDFILTSPPFWDILSRRGSSSKFYKKARSYGNDPRDLSMIGDYDDFVTEVAEIGSSLKRILKRGRYIALIVSDFRKNSRLYAFHADLIRAVEERNDGAQRKLVLQGITILAQNQKRLMPYGFPTTYVPNIHHSYVLIFRNV